MKTLKIVFLLIFSFNFSYAQFGGLTYSINQIRSTYKEVLRDVLVNEFESKNGYSMFAKFENYSLCYFANSDSIIYESIVVPLNKESIEEMKKYVKDTYEKKSDSTYTYYGMIIEECYPDENDPLKRFSVYYKYYFPKEKYRYY